MTHYAPGHILIIGSGIGGLSTGILLSSFNYKVTVVERTPLPGGLMRSYRRDGIDCPTGIHYLGALDEGQPLRRLWDYFGITPLIPLERMGRQGIIDRYIFDDFVFDVPDGMDAFEDNLLKMFPDEGGPISAIMRDLRETTQSLAGLDAVLSPAMVFLTPQQLQPMGQRVGELGCSSKLTAVLSVPSNLIGVPLKDCPALFYFMILAAYLMSSWRLAVSSNVMVDAFLSRFKSLGGEVITGDGVKAVAIDSGRASGVLLESGRTISATAVVSAVHPQIVLSLLPSEAVKTSYADRVAGIENTTGLFGVNLAVRAESNPILSHNIYRLHPEEDGAVYRGVFHQIRATGNPGVNLLSMITASGIEQWRPWEKTMSGNRGEAYEAAKAEKAQQLISGAQQLFGPLTGLKILDSYTPLTIRDWVNSPDGSPYGILRSSGQLLKAASLNRTPVKNLYIAGQNRIFPGIMGTILGSFQVARQMIGPEKFSLKIAGEFL